MELKPGYKQTEVGVIPKDWETRTIGQVFRLINGCAFKPEDWKEQGTPIIRIQNLNDPAAPFNYSDAPVEARHRVEPGDLLFAWSGTTVTSFGARVWSGPAGVLNQHIFKMITDPRELAPEFSLLVLQRVQQDIEKKAHGFKASFVHVRRPDLIKVNLPVPPIREQRVIAAALGDADALIGALDRLIAKKRDLKQAAMQQLLTGQRRLPGFVGEWQVKRLGDVAHIKTGGKNNDDKVEDGAYPLFVRSQTVERIDTYSYDCEAVLVPGEGGIGSIFHYINGKFDCHQRVYKISAFDDATCGKFIFYCMKNSFHKQATRNSVKATVDSLRLPTFLQFEFLAPTREEQAAIATVLSDVDAEIAALERRRDKTRALKQGMMQELLTGRTRLV